MNSPDPLRDALAPPEPEPAPLTHDQLVDLALAGRRLPGEPEPAPPAPLSVPSGPRGTAPGGDFLRAALRARRSP
jgi:hypothetical protein